MQAVNDCDNSKTVNSNYVYKLYYKDIFANRGDCKQIYQNTSENTSFHDDKRVVIIENDTIMAIAIISNEYAQIKQNKHKTAEISINTDAIRLYFF